MMAWIISLFSGLIGVVVGAILSYLMNLRLEKKKQKQVCSVLNDILKQTKIILNGTIGYTGGYARSPYGYFKNAHEETQAVMPLFDNIIADLGVLPPSKNKTLVIELYTELKGLLSNGQKYKIKLENLRKFRKEMIPKKFIKLNCKNSQDYFDIDPYLFKEESNRNSIIDKDFFKAQKILIDDLIHLTNISWYIYEQLIEKIDTILNHSWEAKK